MSHTETAWWHKVTAAPAFEGVAAPEVARLFSVAFQRRLQNRQNVFLRGDPSTNVYIVVEGAVRISTDDPTGRKKIIAEIFRKNEMFGEIAAIDDGVRTADASADGVVDLAVIPVSAFQALLHSSAPFANNMLRMTVRRIRRTYSLLEDASLLRLEERLARQVLYLVGLGASGTTTVRLHTRLNQEELADLLGATSRSIINILNTWRESNLASFDGRTAQLTILDMARFRSMAAGLQPP